MTAEDLARALVSRLDHRRTALTTTLDIEEHVSEPAADPAARTLADLHALDVFNSLSDRERLILTRPEATVRELVSLAGVGKSQAGTIRQRLFERLSVEFADDEDADGAVTRLRELCDYWRYGRTGTEGATSDD
jgi:hypothetical protein